MLEGHNIGALAHVCETSAFFQGLIESRNQFSSRTDLNIAEAYLIGFLGHYTLDTICHPYIYTMTHYKDKKEKAYFSRHAYLETDIDTALLDLKLHRQPCNFHTEDTIRLTHRQKHVIASMLYYAYRYAFPDVKFRKYTMYLAIFSMQLGLWLMHDDSGKKKAIVRLTERICLGYPAVFTTDPE